MRQRKDDVVVGHEERESVNIQSSTLLLLGFGRMENQIIFVDQIAESTNISKSCTLLEDLALLGEALLGIALIVEWLVELGTARRK